MVSYFILFYSLIILFIIYYLFLFIILILNSISKNFILFYLIFIFIFLQLPELPKLDLKNVKTTNIFEKIIDCFRNFSSNSKNSSSKEIKTLKNQMNVEKLLIGFVTLNLPTDLLRTYLQLDESDPDLYLFLNLDEIQKNEISKFALFLDRFDTYKNLLFLFVWSTSTSELLFLVNASLRP